jgi:hypothetical protein
MCLLEKLRGDPPLCVNKGCSSNLPFQNYKKADKHWRNVLQLDTTSACLYSLVCDYNRLPVSSDHNGRLGGVMVSVLVIGP